MIWTEDHVHSLQEAIATGARRVQYHDKVVEYKSLSEMLTALEIITNAVYGKALKCNRRYASTSKGTR